MFIVFIDSMESNSTLLSPASLRLKSFSSSFDSSSLQRQTHIPGEFIWPQADRVDTFDELMEPVVDLQGFFRGDEADTLHAAALVRDACLQHGFFQVTNHGVDDYLIQSALSHMDYFFKLPLHQKLRAHRKPGSVYGYVGAHADRFSSKLPWKETLSFAYNGYDNQPIVVDYFKNVLGKNFIQTGLVYQQYCNSMSELSLSILELLAISLGIDRLYFRKFFEDCSSIMRCNRYPTCQDSGLVLGTGPHCDPTSLTILYQDQVEGLQVFEENKWYTIKPRPDAFVINLGDTFMALSNGRYKSCLHRAVVNKYQDRRSLAFFLCPKEDKVVKPPVDIINKFGPRKYPDFTWSSLLEFTQKHYRSDMRTFQSFIQWHLSST